MVAVRDHSGGGNDWVQAIVPWGRAQGCGGKRGGTSRGLATGYRSSGGTEDSHETVVDHRFDIDGVSSSVAVYKSDKYDQGLAKHCVAGTAILGTASAGCVESFLEGQTER